MSHLDRDESDGFGRGEAIEFALTSCLMVSNGDLMSLLESAHELDESDQVLAVDDDGSPFKGGFMLFRQISKAWIDAGRPRYVLSSSMASLMVSTKAPQVTDETLSTPFDVFVLEVPGEWTSMPGIGPLFVLLLRMQMTDESTGTAIVAARRFVRPSRVDENDTRLHGVDLPDVCVRVVSDAEVLSETDAGNENRRLRRTTPSYFTEAVRYLVNTCCFVTAHQECAPRRTGRNAPRNANVHDVRPPADVAVTSEFRRYARQLVADRRIAERKESLLHIVRGHWKRQVKGAGRSDRELIWIRPYQRGSDSIGRIVEKTLRISGDR